MKKLSLILALVFVLSSLVAAPLSVSADTDTLLGYWTGWSSTSAKTDDTTDFSSWTYTATTTTPYGTFSYGYEKPQKSKTDDAAFHYTYDAASTDLFATRRVHFFNNDSKCSAVSGKNYMTFEFDFLLGTNTSSVAVYLSPSSGNRVAAAIYASETAKTNIKTGASNTTLPSAPGGTVDYVSTDINKWHRARAVFPINGQSDTMKLYIDDMTTTVSELTPGKVMTGIENDTATGIAFLNYTGSTTDVYIDNLKIYAGNGVIDSTAAPVLTSAGEDSAISGQSVTLPDAAKVSDMMDNAVISNGVFVGIYDSTLTTKRANTDEIQNGDIIVVADNGTLDVTNSAGLYSYYTVSVAEAPTLSVYDLSVSVSGTTATVNYSYNNTYDDSKNVIIIAAVYNGNNLVDAVPVTVSVPSGENTAASEEIALKTVTDANKVKVFAINSFESLTPYCGAAENSIAQ